MTSCGDASVCRAHPATIPPPLDHVHDTSSSVGTPTSRLSASGASSAISLPRYQRHAVAVFPLVHVVRRDEAVMPRFAKP